MKHRVTVLCLAFLLTAVIVACQSGGANDNTNSNSPGNSNAPATAPTGAVDQKAVVDEVRATLAAHDKALSDRNLDAVMATFATSPDAVVLGTGADEKWVGQADIRAAYTEIFKDYDTGTFESNCDWKTGGADDSGTMGWLAAICSCKDSQGGKAREYKLNVSASLKKQDGKWRFVMLHMSNAFQPPVTK